MSFRADRCSPTVRLLTASFGLLVVGAVGCVDERGDELVGNVIEAELSSPEPCDPSVVGDDEGPVTSVYAIKDGFLDGLCWGEPDETVTGAFEVLESVTVREQLVDLHFVAGFDGGADTLAFVVPTDDDFRGFVMAIDTVSAVDDPGSLRLTVLHEFAHVFTQRNDQLDVWADPDSCPTLWNGAGCFVPGSYIDDWISRFWSDDELRTLPFDAVDEEAGIERCEIDPGFLGAYAASGPEEDFAETYSAFVFDLDVAAGVEPRMAFFEDYPELVQSRDLARRSTIAAVPNLFDRCG